MGPADSRVWSALLQEGGIKFDSIEYDVRLGGKQADLVDLAHPHFAMWQTLLMKRVDVLGWQGKVPWIIEVKPHGSFAALGQALGYCDLWEREKGTQPKPVPCVACAVLDPDLKPTFERYGVKVLSLLPSLAERVLALTPEPTD